MTSSRAAVLRARWELRPDQQHCPHIALEMESNKTGYVTGQYICVVCGETLFVPLARSPKARPEEIPLVGVR